MTHSDSCPHSHYTRDPRVPTTSPIANLYPRPSKPPKTGSRATSRRRSSPSGRSRRRCGGGLLRRRRCVFVLLFSRCRRRSSGVLTFGSPFLLITSATSLHFHHPAQPYNRITLPLTSNIARPASHTNAPSHPTGSQWRPRAKKSWRRRLGRRGGRGRRCIGVLL